jgi:hypothetical protein
VAFSLGSIRAVTYPVLRMSIRLNQLVSALVL